MQQCRISGCAKPVRGWGVYCDLHKATSRRHGDAAQTGVTKAELAPYVRKVRARIKKNPANGAWDRLRSLWASAGEAWAGYLADGQRGAVQQTDIRTASERMHRVYQDATFTDVMETTLAMFLMQEDQPRRFRSDRAFRFQVARRVLRLTDHHIGMVQNRRTGVVGRYYREVTPAAMERIGKDLEIVFGMAGLKLAGMEAKDRENRKETQKALWADLEGLR